jgi:hypothetical protein
LKFPTADRAPSSVAPTAKAARQAAQYFQSYVHRQMDRGKIQGKKVADSQSNFSGILFSMKQRFRSLKNDPIFSDRPLYALFGYSPVLSIKRHFSASDIFGD